MLKRWFLVFLVAAIAVGGAAFALAQDSNTVTVEVVVWRSVSNPSRLFVSTRPEGGKWQTLDTALDMRGFSKDGKYNQSNVVRVEVTLPDPTPEPRTCETSRAPWSSFRQSAREEARDRVRQPDGTFTGRYTGVVRSQDGIQVDHIVPRNYACENGGLDWDDEQIRGFVNDQDNLAVVASSENTRKGDKGPAGYLPALDRCWYAARWEALAERYDLDLPARDQAVLDATLAEPACETSSDATATPEAIATPTPTPTPTRTPTPTPTPTPAAATTHASCDAAEAAGEERVRGSNGPGRGFLAHLVPSARDGDSDGVVCER